MNPSIESSSAIVAILHLARELNELIAQDNIDDAITAVQDIIERAEFIEGELFRVRGSK